VRKQKTDRRDAKHILQLLLEGRFSRIWVPNAEMRDHRQLLVHRHIVVKANDPAKEVDIERVDRKRVVCVRSIDVSMIVREIHNLVAAAKLAPRYSHELALVYERERQRGNKNRATLAVARKMVAYMLAVERRKQDFVPADEFRGTAAA
jgi:hypothetical protein